MNTPFLGHGLPRWAFLGFMLVAVGMYLWVLPSFTFFCFNFANLATQKDR